jgi:exodeoxyribonuclease V beta subunit
MNWRITRPQVLVDLANSGKAHAAIEASAGTGKTFTLENLLLEMVLGGTPLEKILVVTFTEKAALELKQRVRTTLEKVSRFDQEPPSREPECPERTITAADLPVVRKALADFDRSTISTIHGFCQMVLKESAFEGGRLFRQNLVDEGAVFDRAFEELVRESFGADPCFQQLLEGCGKDLEGLRKFLKDALKDSQAKLTPIVGSLGKLEVDVVAIKRLPDTPEALGTFLRNAGLSGKTPKSLADRLVPSWTAMKRFAHDGDMARLRAMFPAKDLAGNSGWAREFRDFDGGGTDLQGALAETRKVMAYLVASLPGIAQHCLPALRERMEAIKASEGLFDFGDMIARVHEDLSHAPEGALAARLRERYQVALLDEFQDTDLRQWNIFRTLFLREGHRLVIVGDPKQAIYSFRGGDLPTYRAARQALLDASAADLTLRENRRSTSAVIAAYNDLFQARDPDTSAAFFSGPNRYEQPVLCGDPALRWSGGEILPPPIHFLDPGPQETVGPLRTTLAEALARHFKHLMEAGLSFGPRGPEEPKQLTPLRWRDMFVLTRSEKEGRLVAKALRREGIPFAFFKQDGLFQSAEAIHLRDLLRAVANPEDPGRRGLGFITPYFGMRMQDLDRPHPEVAKARLWHWHKLARDRDFPAFFHALTHESGLIPRLLLLDPGERALTNLLHLHELLLEASLEGRNGLEDLLRRLERWISGDEQPPGENGNVQRLETEGDAVQILTMHKSKGLEATVVAVFGGFSESPARDTTLYPGPGGERCLHLGPMPLEVKQAADQYRDEEEERLFYVALTRAQGQLVLPWIRLKENGKDFSGAYQPVMTQLRRLHGAGGLPPAPVILPAVAGDLAATQHLVQLPKEAPGRPSFEALHGLARSCVLASFTSIVKGMEADHEDGDPDPEPDAPTAPRPRSTLPGGTQAGQALHRILERLPLDHAAALDEKAFRDDPQIRALVERELRAHALKLTGVREAAELVRRAACRPMDLGFGESVPLVALDPARMVREMDFVMDLMPPWLAGGASEHRLRGSLDLCFEHQGRVNLLDWKSNTLAGYDPASLAACVEEHYWIQVHLYALVACRHLGIATEADYEGRFGSVLYVFLRAEMDEGVWRHRPAWADLVAWSEVLASLDADGRLTAEVPHV